VTLPAGILTAFEVLSTLAGAAYVVLAARRNRLCWIAGAISAALFAVPAGLKALPMQSGLQVFYVVMSIYGWLNWSRASREGDLPVGTWSWQRHLGAAIAVVLLSYLSAHWLAVRTQAEWPLLDSLTTWFSLLATWLAARAKLENWIYWIVIDGVLVFLCFMQKMPFMALQYLVFIVIAVGGFIAWRRRMLAQAVPA
jgi:nicotinamide mononucleotide transporter